MLWKIFSNIFRLYGYIEKALADAHIVDCEGEYVYCDHISIWFWGPVSLCKDEKGASVAHSAIVLVWGIGSSLG